MLKLCIDNAPLVAKLNKDTLVNKGQGEGVTKWNGWSWKLLLTKLVIFINTFQVQLVWFIVILFTQAELNEPGIKG